MVNQLSNPHHNNVDALVWLDTSAEQDALYRQAFSLAKLRIEKRLEAGTPGPHYIITDCDETILDNSEYNSWLVQEGRNFHDGTWDSYCRDCRSHATPGAQEFFGFLRDRGVEAYYVTGRNESTRQQTAHNLALLGFPISPEDRATEPDPAKTRLFMGGMKFFVNPELDKTKHVKFRQFEHIIARHGGVEPILYLGDNLGDFDSAYKYLSAKKAPDWSARLKSAGAPAHKGLWGERWIVFPNPVYGDFLRSYQLSDSSGVVTPLADDSSAARFTEQQVRPALTPAMTPKLSQLELWPT